MYEEDGWRKDNEQMTEKLYYKDAYLTEFTTNMLREAQTDGGEWYIVLAETAFYPTGGGQPYDTGTLNDIPVINVEEVDGEVRHFLARKMDRSDRVHGVVNWERRFDHMQQHSGQHVLTAAFVELFQLPTVSFHLGVETCTIDLSTDYMTEDILQQVEKRANEVILESRPIETKWVTEEEAKEYQLRKELAVTDDIRLVIIPDFDYNGCGGTHPNSTSQIGSIKILGWEKQRNQIRIEFICGERVLKQLHEKHSIMKELGRIVSASQDQMVTTVIKMVETQKSLAKKVDELQDELLKLEGESLVAKSRDWHGESLVTGVFQDRSIKELQKLAKIIISEKSGINLMLVAENGEQLQFVFARDALGTINMKEAVKLALPLINGKGGGSEHSAQGGGEALISGHMLLEKVLSSL